MGHQHQLVQKENDNSRQLCSAFDLQDKLLLDLFSNVLMVECTLVSVAGTDLAGLIRLTYTGKDYSEGRYKGEH